MTIDLWVKIPKLDPYKPNQVPLKIGNAVFGEVQEILKVAPNNQYQVRALIYKNKEKEFLDELAKFR